MEPSSIPEVPAIVNWIAVLIPIVAFAYTCLQRIWRSVGGRLVSAVSRNYSREKISTLARQLAVVTYLKSNPSAAVFVSLSFILKLLLCAGLFAVLPVLSDWGHDVLAKYEVPLLFGLEPYTLIACLIGTVVGRILTAADKIYSKQLKPLRNFGWFMSRIRVEVQVFAANAELNADELWGIFKAAWSDEAKRLGNESLTMPFSIEVFEFLDDRAS